MDAETVTEPAASAVQFQPQVSPPPAHESVEDILKAAGCAPSLAQQLAGQGMNEQQARGWAARAQAGGVGWAGLRADVFRDGPAAFDRYERAD